jgi:hypothetical protein
MAFYFRPFPLISYRMPGTNNNILAMDITRRFSIANFVRNANVNFDEYQVQDGERPDIVAYDYYGDETLDWLVLLANEIQDPYYEWPLSNADLQAMILQKYGTLSYAYQTNHHYEKIVREQQIVIENGLQRIIPEKKLIVDYQTYLTLPSFQRKAVSLYEFEVNQNEDRRQIYLIDLHYTQLIKEQHPYIFEEGYGLR